ncbi:MAG: hypothetical protein AAF439_14665 [Pseudomonadota bacterium]
MLKPALMIAAAALLTACSQHAVQVSSGEEYLAGYSPVKGTPQPTAQRTVRRTSDGEEIVEDRIDTVSTDDLIRHAAQIEPLLRLPARIGIARIDGGQLSTIPNGEAEMWQQLGRRHSALGTFAAIDPFLADYTLRTVQPQDARALRRDAHDVITQIRLGAARQHMDAVLIYEIGTRRHYGDAFPGLGPSRILGAAPLPAKAIAKEGTARAFLMDVRNGYPYGVASASADLKALETSFWDDQPKDRQSIAAKSMITKALLPQVEQVIGQLVNQMQTRLASAK